MSLKAKGYQRLVLFFRPPVFKGDEEKTHTARVLNYLLFSIFIMILLFGLVVIPLFIEKKIGGSIFLLIFSSGLLFSRYLMYGGRVQAASRFLIASSWVTVVTMIILGAGLRDMNFVFLVSTSVIAGLLLGRRFVTLIVISNMVFCLALVLMERLGTLPIGYFPNPPMVRWFELSFSLITAATALHLALRSREESLTAARNQLNERKQAEQALQESDKRYRLIAENIADIFWTMDLNYSFTYVSPSVTRMRGFTVQEALSQNFSEIMTPQSLQAALQAVQEDQELRQQNPVDKDRKLTIELEEYRKDGSTVWTENEITYLLGEDQQPIGIVGVTRDISEQKRIKAALRASEERFRSLIQSSSDIILIIDEDGEVTFESPSLERTLGYPSGTFIGQSPLSVIHPDNLDQVRNDLSELSQSANNGIPTEFRCRKADGSWVYLEAVGHNLFNNPSIHGIVLNIRDITRHKLAEKALRESEAQYRTLIETTGTGFVIIDPEGRVLDANEEYVHLTGYHDLKEILSRSVIEWTADYEKIKNEEAVQECLREGKIRNLEIDYSDFEGKVTPVEINATVVKREGRRQILSLCRDITERKLVEKERQRLEERLRHAEKMESLGRLAGGVAHDLNNVLGVLVGYSELLLMDIPQGDPLRKHVSNILQSSQRGAAIIQDLLTLARRGVAVSTVVNLNNIISGYFETPEFGKLKEYHSGIIFKFDPAIDLLNIRGSSVHLGKTVMNLVSNAAEAIADRGEVLVRTENRYLDKPIQGYDTMEEGEYVVLTVSDNGNGIPVKDIGRIFEPFYTKKVMGRSGTGLGLAVVWGTVKDHGGFIDVQSREGEGSTFTLYFPVIRQELTREEGVVPPEEYAGRGESILVVDDVKEQRELATAMLSRMGYKVASVSSGEEALSFLKTSHPDLLVLDMIMDPGMDGLETYQRILEINPKQKAIIVSGFSETSRVKKTQELGAGAYVRKPYISEKIGLAVRRELDKI
ncbi:MAG: PAS domain S-box protein [Deltaproteobacteria bacterium]|nr:PAS domain S-box protein [Deltaproteobacteria bacterium]